MLRLLARELTRDEGRDRSSSNSAYSSLKSTEERRELFVLCLGEAGVIGALVASEYRTAAASGASWILMLGRDLDRERVRELDREFEVEEVGRP